MELKKIVSKKEIKKLYKLEKEIFKEESYSFQQMEEIFLMENYSCYILMKDAQIKGYIILFDNSEAFEIMKIGVLELERKQGVGNKILRDIKRLGKDIFLEVREGNYPAISFYEKNYFKKIGIRKNYYKNSENAILMLFSKENI
ncbi:GNAT family N-acetyltransferase [Fusobacterium sp. MFO224]|uniref:GNAT family N-acetyltransferase n=1 Tax=Fusobacterium sp. MFO224 TaxID=3378070 RepID=UPI0038541BF6